MTSTTFQNFNDKTEASAVATAFGASISGRTILITGVNKLGVGYTTAQALSSQAPRRLILCGRSEGKLQECLDGLRPKYPDVDFRLLIVDLGSQKSVRKAAEEVLSWEDTPTIDIVINNAGVMNIPERTLSEDGIEAHLATNHVGHFLLTNLILSKVIASAKSSKKDTTRIVNVSSMATMVSPVRFSDLTWEMPISKLPEQEKPNVAMMKMAAIQVDDDSRYIAMGAYAQSKTANVLYSVALNEKLYEKHGVLALALNPGEVTTELQRTTDKKWLAQTEDWRKQAGVEQKTQEQGASTSLVAALDPKLGKPGEDGYGQFLSDCQISKIAPPYALDQIKAEKLWEVTEGFVNQKFSW